METQTGNEDKNKMRPIKFRAWDLQKKCFLKDYEFWILGNGSIWYRDQWGKNVLAEHLDVSFSTGLLEKNGREIYEGDIVANGSGRICEIKWHKYSGRWDAHPLNSVGTYKNFINDKWRECEVIGNIYESPELLK